MDILYKIMDNSLIIQALNKFFNMSEQDKRPLYMGTYERYKKEMNVKHDDINTQLAGLRLWVKYNAIVAGLALGIAIASLAI